MKKIILALIMIINIAYVPVYAEETYTASDITQDSIRVDVADGTVTISGNTESKDEIVSICLLHKGKTLEDFENMKTSDDFNLTVRSTQFAVSDKNKEFSASFDNTNGEFYGCVYVVTSTTEKSSGVIIEDSIRHIVFDDDKITVIGESDLEKINLLLLDSQGAEYQHIESVVLEDEFSVEIPIDYNDAYDLYVTNGADKISGCYKITAPKKIYISKDGNDENEGTQAAPLKTISAARDAARNYKNCPVNVIIKSGEYDITEATAFTAEDSRAVDAPLRFMGEGEVTFSGAKELSISAFSLVTDESVKGRMYEGARDKVLVMDLKAQGVSDALINFITRCGTAAYKNSINPVRFYLNDEEQKLSRYPNEGYKRIASVSNEGSTSADSEVRAVFNVGEDVSRWKNASDMFIEGEIGKPWIAEWARVKSVDGENITLANYTYDTVKANYKWAAVNLLEEIDIPGEYFIDSNSGLLYYYPPKKLTDKDKFEIAAYDENVFEIDNCANLQFDGIDFEKLNNNAETTYYSTRARFVFTAENTEKLLVRNCDFTDIGGAVIRAWTNPYMITIDNCKVTRVARGLANIFGGSIVKLTDVKFRVKNCEISQWGRLSVIMPAIVFNGRGMKVTDTVFHNGECMAISFGGQNITISNNEFNEVCTELSDMGAVYTGRNWTTADVNVCNNYFKNIGPKEEPISNNAVCVYVDDAINNVNIMGNIFVGRDNTRSDLNAIHYTQGPNIVMDGNTFVNFDYAVCVSYRTKAAFEMVYATLSTIPYKSAWYNIKYPYFKTLASYNNYWDMPIIGTKSSYTENSSISENVMIDVNKTKYCVSDDYHWNRTMDIAENNNKTLDYSALVNTQTNDYRIKAEYIEGLSGDIKTENNSEMSDFGTKQRYLEFGLAELCDVNGNALSDVSSGQSIVVKDKIDGTDFVGKNVTYALAVYDKNGKLVKVDTNDIKISSDAEKQTVLSTVLPELGENCIIKLMRFNNFTDLKPLSKSSVIFEK